MMLLAMFMFTSMGICIRLSAAFMPVVEVVFFRNILAVLLLVPLLVRQGASSISMNRPKLFFGRAVVNFIGMICGFTAVTLIPLSTMTALSFTGPIFVTVGAALFLGEVIRTRRIIAIAVGFVGTLIILRPGLVEISLGTMLALASAVAIAAAILLVKKMTESEKDSAIVFWMVMLQTPLSLVPALFVWVWPAAEAWIYLWAMALCGTIGHLLFTRALALVEVTSLQPLEFAKLPFAVLLAWIVFSEWPDIWIWVGGSVIFASTAYITRREAQIRQSSAPQTKADVGTPL